MKKIIKNTAIPFTIIKKQKRFQRNSQGIVVLQLGVDVLNFPLSLLHQPLFFNFGQNFGFHPFGLLNLHQNYEQLKRRTRC